MTIDKLLLSEKYEPKILGLGEVYEQISVESQRKKLKNKFGSGKMFLCANKEHSGRGLSLKELEKQVRKKGYQILDVGLVDSPPWPSKKISQPKSWLKNPLIINLARILFYILIYFEPFCKSEKCSHMVYVLGKKLPSA